MQNVKKLYTYQSALLKGQNCPFFDLKNDSFHFAGSTNSGTLVFVLHCKIDKNKSHNLLNMELHYIRTHLG